MKRVRKKLPRFKNEGEEAEFWATHDTGDYWDQFNDVEEPLELDSKLARTIDRRARRKRLISIRLESWQLRLARAVAARRHMPYHAVIRNWVSEGIRSGRAG